MATITSDDLTTLLRQSSPRLHVHAEPSGKLFVTGPVDVALLAHALNIRALNAPEALPTDVIVSFIRDWSSEDGFLEQ